MGTQDSTHLWWEHLSVEVLANFDAGNSTATNGILHDGVEGSNLGEIQFPELIVVQDRCPPFTHANHSNLILGRKVGENES